MVDEQQYLTVKQFAERAGVSTQRIYQLLTKSLQEFCKTENGTKYISVAGLSVFSKPALQPLAKDLPSDLQGLAKDLPSDLQGLAKDLPSDLQGLAKDLPSDLQGLAKDLPSDLQEKDTLETGLLKETIEALRQQLTVKDGQLAAMDAQLSVKDEQLATKDVQLSVKDEQLAAKDKQIADLTAALVSAQEQHKALTDALTAAQALHAGTLQERLVDQSGSSEGQQREAAVVEDVSVAEAPAQEPERTEEPIKLKWWQRIFRKK